MDRFGRVLEACETRVLFALDGIVRRRRARSGRD